MTEREYQLVNENYRLRERLRKSQDALRKTRARLRLWPERQRAWRRERRALEDQLVQLRRRATTTSFRASSKNRKEVATRELR